MIPQNIRWSTANPGLLIILVDQTNTASFVGVPDIANAIINEIILLCFDGRRPKNKSYIRIIGYNNEVRLLQSGDLQYFEANPIRVEGVIKKLSDGAGGILEIETPVPIWIQEEYPDSAGRNMYEAFELSNDIIEGWIEQYPERPAPIIINIAAGLPYDSFFYYTESMLLKKVTDFVESIKTIATKTSNEKIQIINILVEDSLNKYIFPKKNSDFTLAQDFFYEISTELPNIQGMYDAEKYQRLVLDGGTRSFVYNIGKDDIRKLVECLFNYNWWQCRKLNGERFNS